MIPLWFFLLSGGAMYLLGATVMRCAIYRNLSTIKKGVSQ